MSDPKEWTLMFFFASDNPLSPLIVSQLKAIKDAGFQADTDVLVHFDPREPGEPTRVFHVNALARDKREKELQKSKNRNGERATRIGDGKDPFVRDMSEDEVDPKILEASGLGVKRSKRGQGDPTEEVNASDALTGFLNFCAKEHRAKHYVLFLVGHGMIVGNDAFLPDDNPVSAVSLEQLGSILRNFTADAKKDDGVFEMLAMHSCSMSSIEVAYQLKGTANLMMASQGLSFIGSWPYRKLLKETFLAVEPQPDSTAKTNASKTADAIPTLMENLYCLSLLNATDFMLAGLSSDLALCKLETEKVIQLKEPLQDLVARLKQGLPNKEVQELIQSAHLKSQSFWGERYTDLFDFCQCLSKACATRDRLQGPIKKACERVMKAIEAVVHSENFGSEYQYSHGLSVFFPWSEPLQDNGTMKKYAGYDFNTEFGKNSWFDFLQMYFEETQRESRDKEDGLPAQRARQAAAVTNAIFNSSGMLADGEAVEDKPTGATGVGCGCPSIKNYPTKNKLTPGKTKRTVRAPLMTEGVFQSAFKKKL